MPPTWNFIIPKVRLQQVDVGNIHGWLKLPSLPTISTNINAQSHLVILAPRLGVMGIVWKLVEKVGVKFKT